VCESKQKTAPRLVTSHDPPPAVRTGRNIEMGAKIDALLKATIRSSGSDLHVKSGLIPRVRINGELIPLNTVPLSEDEMLQTAEYLMGSELFEEFLRTHEADFAYVSEQAEGRFRVNAFQSRSATGFVFRHLIAKPITLEQLQMPPVISRLALEPRGLVLVTGPTGSGKTTTLAGMVDLINDTRAVHVLTVEDPIEILHSDKKAVVNQRELRTDTAGWEVALRAAMRQDPDVILIGEMRDVETVRAALQAAETGHFVMSTLHTTDAAETVNRVIDFFPPHEQKQIRLSLSDALRGIVCQRLIPNLHGTRTAVMEIAVNTPRVAEAIADPDKTGEIEDIVGDSSYYGMRTFQQHLVELVLGGVIGFGEARTAASNAADFELAVRKTGFQIPDDDDGYDD
jgi:twitching motility protein PilT